MTLNFVLVVLDSRVLTEVCHLENIFAKNCSQNVLTLRDLLFDRNGAGFDTKHLRLVICVKKIMGWLKKFLELP